METINFRNITWYFIFTVLLFSGCRKDDPVPVVIPEADVVDKFIWNGLHDYYLWNNLVDNLTDAKFSDKDSLNAFLNRYTDHQVLFSDLLYKYGDIDKWSFLVDNSQTIDDWISGTSKSMGYDFMLGRIGSSNDLFAFVRYVLKGSPADIAGIKRGDFFLTVNGSQLNVSNYENLLFSLETYKIGFATISNNNIAPGGESPTMNAIEIQENPILLDTVFTYDNKNIGYLVYNGFNSDFDIQLNDAIGKLKAANIDEMVLDLRYNGGGSVQSSKYLASMLYGTDKTKVFDRAKYNDGLEAYFIDTYGQTGLNDYFTAKIDATDKTPETAINTLNLQKLYVIVSDNTASASELLINGLKPYMTVKVVGINTVGKYTGSMTIKDWDEQGNVNPNHTYAMQPIVVKYANSAGISDFVNGLTPDITAEEDFRALLPFGDPNEDLLKYVLADIKGVPVSANVFKSALNIRKFADSHDFKPFAHEMYINLKNKIQK